MPSVPTSARPRLIASQLRALLNNPEDARAAAAGRELMDRFVRLHAAGGADTLRENANALMTELAPSQFDAAQWSAPASAHLRAALGNYAVVFHTLQAHLNEGTSTASPRATVPPLPSELARPKGLILTITGELLPQESVPEDLVVLFCENVGKHSQRQWDDATREIAALAPLLLGVKSAHTIVRRVLLTQGEERASVMRGFEYALKDAQVHPRLRPFLVDSLTLVRSTYALPFARAAAVGFRPFIDALTLDSGMKALATLHTSALDVLLPLATSSDANAQWVASIAMVLAGHPDDPAHRGDMAQLLCNLAPNLAARTPNAVLNILEGIVAERADRQGLVQATQTLLHQATVSSWLFVEIMGALQQASPHARMAIALSLAPYRTQLWDGGALTRVISTLAALKDVERGRFLRQFDWLFRGARNLDPETFAGLVTRMASLEVVYRDTLIDLAKNFAGPHADLVQRAQKLELLAQMDPPAAAALQRLGEALPSSSLHCVLEVLKEIHRVHREHVVDCAVRLAPSNHPRGADINAASAIRFLGTKDNLLREFMVTHLQAMGFDLRLEPLTLTCVFDCLSEMTSDKRAAVVRAFRRLATPAINQAQRADMLQQLARLSPSDLPEFAHSCRLAHDWDNLGGIGLMSALSAMSATFDRGERLDPYRHVDMQNVHRAMFTKPAIQSIKALQSMRHVPQLTMEKFVEAVSDYIDGLEEDTPEDHPDRQIQAHRTRTLFDDARHALKGPRGPRDWSSFADNDEDFLIDGQQGVFVGDLANLVWQSILTYPENAVRVPLAEDAVDADKATMLRNFIVKFADCIEDGARVCYAGKTMRILEAVQGFVAGVGVDDLKALSAQVHVPDETLPAGTLLTMETSAFAHRAHEPTLIQVEAFVAHAVAAGEQQWATQDSERRRAYLGDLQHYVGLTYDEFDEAHPDIWSGLFDTAPRPSSAANPQ